MAVVLELGPFRLDVESETLFHGPQASPLGRKAVALLKALVDRAGEPVSKQALMEAAWPALVVEESNLTVQMAALRKFLDQAASAGHWIETLPRRGYRYVGPWPPEQPVVAAVLPLPDKPSIAVLPFLNAGPQPDPDYLADGMVDDIVTGLSRIKWLFVIAKHSTVAYEGSGVDVRQVGRELGVRYVLGGSVRRAENRVRVTCRLFDATSGSQVWAERFDHRSDDIFALQDDIAQSAVGAIAPGLRRVEIDRVKRKRPESLDAYEFVLRAQPDVDSGMPARVRAALVLLERAVALDPTYALAHANAAMCHHCLYLRDGLKEAQRLASIDRARQAIVYGQDDALALTLAGFSIGMDGHDRAAAFSALDAALAISPSSALTYILGSVILAWGGEADRAIEWSERGMRLSPFDPWAFAAFDAQALSHFHRGRYDAACRAAYRSVQANPEHSITYVQLAAALSRLGRLVEAREAARRVLELHPTFRFGRQFAGVHCEPGLARAMGDALQVAGLPE